MRVTENTNYDLIRDKIGRSKEKIGQLQTQAATMKRVNTPSDDPAAAAKLMELRTEQVNFQQYRMNSKVAETFLNSTDQALSSLSEIVLRAKEIAIRQSSSTAAGDDARVGIAEEVHQLLLDAMGVANTRLAERYIFGGFKTGTPPINANGEYQGDDGQIMVEVADDFFVSTNITGLEVFNTNPKGCIPLSPGYPNPQNVNLFDEIEKLHATILTGDQEGTRGTLERFDQLHAKLVATRAKVGARLQGLESSAQAMDRHSIHHATLSSSLEDADLAKVMSDLSREETALRSSLATSKRLIQPTLLDFIK